MIEKRAVCRTNPGTADTRRHIVFLRVLEQSGALFLCALRCTPQSRSGPLERQPRRQSRHSPPVSSMPIMCARPCVCKQNRNDMAASGATPVSGVRVMGWRGGEEGEGSKRGERQGAQRCAPVSILYVLRRVLRMVLRSGLVRQSVRFSRERHIVSRDNVIYSEILLNCPELFRD